MARLLTAFVCLVAAISLLPAAPLPAHLMPKDPPLTFPTRVGTTWVYEGNYGEQTIVISAVEEEKDGAKLVTTERVGEGGKRTPHMVTRISAAGVFLMAEQGEKYNTPWCILKLPHRPGQTWETEVNRLGPSFVAKSTAGPVERVTVPAGKFSAVRVDWEGFAAAAGQVDAVRFLLSPAVGADPRAARVNNFTPLHSAAMHGHAAVCELLLQAGAGVNVQTNPQGYAPLHSAAFAGHIEAIRVLLAHGAERGLVNYRGERPADTARRTGQLEAARILEATEG